MAGGDPVNISVLCLDVDGVLTDGSIYIDDHGRESKRFHVRDGSAIRMWMLLGHEVMIITGRRSMAVRHRANELGIRTVIQGAADKQTAFRDALKRLARTADHAAVVADDVPELPIIRAGGYAIAVADAAAEVRREADFVTSLPGGHAAVREAIEHLLMAQGRWEEAVEAFLNRAK